MSNEELHEELRRLMQAEFDLTDQMAACVEQIHNLQERLRTLKIQRNGKRAEQYAILERWVRET